MKKLLKRVLQSVLGAAAVALVVTILVLPRKIAISLGAHSDFHFSPYAAIGTIVLIAVVAYMVAGMFVSTKK